MHQYPIEVFRIDEVKDEKLNPEIYGLPDSAAIIDRFISDCPAIFALPDHLEEPSLPFNNPTPYQDNGQPERARFITDNHGRSFELQDPGIPVVWQDEFGNPYGSINVKGNNFINPDLIEHQTATHDVIAYGLQESQPIRRILRASRIMREAGISTEYILAVAEPAEFPAALIDYNVDWHQSLGLADYKSLIINNHWKNLPEAERTAEKYAELTRNLQRMTFYITMRAMDTSYRLSEFAGLRNAREQVYAIANRFLKPAGAPDFDPDNAEDLRRYLLTVVTPRAATNMAKLHRAGLAHRYPNGLNTTALGSLVDDDSVHGEPLGLGDEPITADDIYRDILENIRSIGRNLYVKQRLDDGSYLNDVIEVYLNIYKGWLLASGEAELPWSQLDIAHAAQEHIKSHPDWGNEELISNSFQVAKEIYASFTPDYSELLKDELFSAFDAWSSLGRAEIIEQGTSLLEKEVDNFAEKIIMEFQNEILAGNAPDGFTIWEEFLERSSVCGEFIYDLVNDAVLEMFLSSDQFFNLFLDEQEASLAAKKIYTFQFIKTDGFEGIGTELQNAFLEKYKEALHAKTTPLTYPSLLPVGTDRVISIKTMNNYFATETDNLPLDKMLLSYTKDHGAILDISSFVENPESDNANFKLSQPDALLTEVITDGIFSDSDSNYVDRLTELNIEKPHYASYVAFVELLPDGTRKLHLQLMRQPHENDDDYDPQSLEPRDSAEVFMRLWNERVLQPKLFDDSLLERPHYEEPAYEPFTREKIY